VRTGELNRTYFCMIRNFVNSPCDVTNLVRAESPTVFGLLCTYVDEITSVNKLENFNSLTESDSVFLWECDRLRNYWIITYKQL